MRRIDDTVERILQRSPFGAETLGGLVARLRDEERMAHSSQALLRALSADPARFRLVNPRRGPWLVERGRPGEDGRWVLALRTPGGSGASFRVERVLRETLRDLGATVDTASFTAPARWLALRTEGSDALGRLQERLRNHPERHSSSESVSTPSKPAARAAA